MTASDHDLIRRGDALKIVKYSNAWTGAYDEIAALPAAEVAVKPLRYVDPEGETLDQMREHARQHPLARKGDMKLVWINEGDLYNHSISVLTVTPSPDVAALVDVVEELLEIRSVWADPHNDEIRRKARATLARVKGGGQ